MRAGFYISSFRPSLHILYILTADKLFGTDFLDGARGRGLRRLVHSNDQPIGLHYW